MSYFAVVLARTEDGWDAGEIDLDEIDEIDDLAEAMRGGWDEAEPDTTFLHFLEQEDTWFAVVRVDGEDDPRVFVSDDSAMAYSAYAEMLLAAAGAEAVPTLDEEIDDIGLSTRSAEDEEPAERGSGPVGDSDLLADLGTSGPDLLALCAKEGMLPSEVLGALADAAGAADALEALR